MFTGIIETIGIVTKGRSGQLVVRPQKTWSHLRVGESIAVDGVCLTLDRALAGQLAFQLLPETLRGTTLAQLRVGARVNLERALRVGSRVGGHSLLGHVDGVGVIRQRQRRRNSISMEIRLPKKLIAGLVPKGPIAVDGISLTLDAKIQRDVFSVHLIPHTSAATTLAQKKAGDRVNIELDLVAKYLWRML